MAAFPPRQLGDYEILESLHETDDTQTFVARQVSIDRPAALVVLKPHRCGDPSAVAAFQADIRAKASVTHPRIAAVYEANTQDGLVFYAREVVAGQDIVALREDGHRFPLSFVWTLLKTVCETFLYYEDHQLGYRAFQPEALVLIHEEPYMANLAIAETTDPSTFTQSLEAIRHSFWRLLRADDTHSPEVRRFFARLDPDHEQVFRDWRDLQRNCNIAMQVTSQPPVTLATGKPSGSASITSSIEPEALRHAQRASTAFSKLLVMLLLVLALGAAAFWFVWNRPVTPVENPMVKVPAGPFIYHTGESMDLPDFWLSQYEITIHQYATFLSAIGSSKAFDHADQPATKTDHAPLDWESYYTAAKANRTHRGHPINLNCPVVGVDWWDAYAYARWRNGRLPSAPEWEKAARGTSGNLFPWGNDADPRKANTGLDYAEATGSGGHQDGYNAWNPVDQVEGDVSPYGIRGMAGNVSEWTLTFGTSPGEEDSAERPIVKGASFLTKESLELTHHRLPDPSKRTMSRGFRIAADGLR